MFDLVLLPELLRTDNQSALKVEEGVRFQAVTLEKMAYFVTWSVC